MTYPDEFGDSGVTKEEKTYGMLCHLLALTGLMFPFGNIIGPLVMWLLKKDSSSFVDIHGKESLNFQISITIYSAICAMLTMILIGIPMLIALVIFEIVFVIKASVKANDGEMFRYPICIRIIQ